MRNLLLILLLVYLVVACLWAFVFFFAFKMLGYDAFACIALRLGFAEILGCSVNIFHRF